ncbi:hypothetical protein BaRGS_00036188 [Batillaria attramentaria]|uniref:Major facilitator superfamily (MFS) profile domain-containing protein n=1 Tax=Batillaria attramentaria TaxID=370345 RepID=A0ABD0JCN4_9CAEN
MAKKYRGDAATTSGSALQGQTDDAVLEPSQIILEEAPSKEDESICFPRKLPPARVMVTLGACAVAEFTLGVNYTTGNMLPYLTSYIRNSTAATSLDYSQSVWIGISNWMTMAATMSFFGLLERRIPHRVYLFIGLVLNSIAFFGSFWAVKYSFALTVIVYGVVQGAAQAIMWPGCVNLALRWFPNRKGLVGGVTMGGYGGGAFAWNQIITTWINPHNLQPDLAVGEDLYFTQREVLDRVPSCFVLLGGILSAIQLVCICLFSYPPPATKNLDTGLRVVAEEGWGPDTKNTGTDSPTVQYAGQSTSLTVSDPPELGEREQIPVDGPNYKPVDILKTRIIWTLWFFNFATDIAFSFITGFYKAWGQTFIHNDRLLALVGSVAPIFNAVCRPVWGLMADRFGFLRCLLLAQTLLTLTSATFITCQYGGAAMFFVWVCMMYYCIGGLYALQYPLLFAIYGSKSFTFSVGFTTSTGVFSTMISVFIASAAKDVFGWNGVFMVGAGCVFLGLLFNFSLFLDCGYPIPARMKKELLDRRTKTARNE